MSSEPPPLETQIDIQEPVASPDPTKGTDEDEQGFQSTLNLLAPVDHLYLEKDSPESDNFIVVDNLGRRLFNASLVQGRVFQAIGVKHKSRAVATYEICYTDMQGYKMTFDFHKTPFHLCGYKRMLGTFPKHHAALAAVATATATAADSEVATSGDIKLYEDQYQIKAIGGDSTCRPCNINAFHIIDVDTQEVVGKISCHWPERPGVFGIKFRSEALNPEVKMLCLAESMTEYKYYFKKQCCCGYVGERGSHCIVFYTVCILCILLGIAGWFIFQYWNIIFVRTDPDEGLT